MSMESGDWASATMPGSDLGDGLPDRTRLKLGDHDPLAHPLRSGRARGTAKRALRIGLVTANRPTAAARMLPTFLIAGAARCGTTSMFGTLSQHPAVGYPFLPW